MYARRVGDRELTFDFAEGLLKNNLLVVDRETDSVWSQLHGKAVIGPLEGQPLTIIASIQTTWGFWKQRHPDTRLMMLPGEEGRPYFYRNRPTGQPSPKTPTREHDLSVLGFGLVIDDDALWVSLEELWTHDSPVVATLGGERVQLYHDKDALTAWAEDESGSLLSGVLAYAEGWLDFFPDSKSIDQALVYPDEHWQIAESPAELGWSTNKLQRAREYAATIDTAAVMIVQGGIVVDAWGETTRKFNVHSIRKSLLSAMVGIYVENGTLNLQSTLAELGIDDRLGLTEAERQTKLVDLLGSRSGVYHPANLVGEHDSKRWPERGSHAPGTHWFYSNWDFNATGAIFEQEAARGIFEAFDELVARPIGMEDYAPRDGLYEPRSGFGGAQGRSVSDFPAYVFRMTARDLARFGLLYLRKGLWNDRQIVPREWVERTTKTTRAVGDYGGHEFFWWISMDGRLYPGVDVGDGAYAAHGAGGHYITIMPAFDLVVVHRVNTNDRTVPVGGTEEGARISREEYGKLLALILEARE